MHDLETIVRLNDEAAAKELGISVKELRSLDEREALQAPIEQTPQRPYLYLVLGDKR